MIRLLLKIIALLFFLGGVSIEVMLLFIWAIHGMTSAPILFHFAASILFVFAYILSIPRRSNYYRPVLFYGLLLILTLPGFGVIAAIMLFALTFVVGTFAKSGVYEEYEKSLIEPDMEAVDVKMETQALRRVRHEVEFESFADVIKGGDVYKKSKVLEKLTKRISSDSIVLLQEATADASAEVRLYAATALLKVEDVINGMIRDAVAKTRQRGLSVDFMLLGDLYKLYSKVGLLEKKVALKFLSLSCDAYRSSLDIDTSQPEVMLHYLQSLIVLGQCEKAQSFLQGIVKIYPNDSRFWFLYASVYYYLNDINQMLEVLSHIKDTDSLTEHEREVVEFWTSEE